jgi:CheY-like chemotaxis protein
VSTPKPDAPARKARRLRKTLLVVEDEKLIRWSIREALRRDYHVRVSSTAEEALKTLGRLKRLDGILVDIRLPGMSGLDFAREARAVRPQAKVFVMTAYNQETAARDAFGVHADGYLAKPFALETLRDMLASHLGCSST